MKYLFYLICLLILVCSCKTQKNSADRNSFTYFTRASKFNFDYWSKNRDKWLELENDTVILTQYLKSSPCDLPMPEKMSMKIVNDTLVFDFGRVYDPNCEREIGIGGILIDFVVNKRKYPNYKKLIIKYKYDNPNWHN